MTIAGLAAAAASLRSVTGWKVAETRRSGSELFLIRGGIDQARSVEAKEYRLTLYVDGEASGERRRGEASVSAYPTTSPEEALETARRAAFAASKSLNPWFELPAPSPAVAVFPESGFAARALPDWMPELREALERRDGEGGASINSLELTLTRLERRILSSRGIDVSFSGYRGFVELTVEARGPGGPVELSDELAFSEPDLGRLSAELERRLELARHRARAEPTPSLAAVPLILAGHEAEAILGWFFANANAARVYSKASPFSLGESVHGREARTGDFDPITLWAEPWLPSAPESSPYDADGFPLARRLCIEAGRVQALVGPSRYAQYLGIPAAGEYSLFSVAPGSAGQAELRAAPHLEVAYFSDFGVDANSGDFGGEIRLGWWFDGAERRPVTGGSVSGSLLENRGRMRMSRELESSGAMLGPAALILPAVSVAGFS